MSEYSIIGTQSILGFFCYSLLETCSVFFVPSTFVWLNVCTKWIETEELEGEEWRLSFTPPIPNFFWWSRLSLSRLSDGNVSLLPGQQWHIIYLQETIPLFIFKLNIPLGYYIAATWDCISPTWMPAKTDTSLLLDSNLISPNWGMNRPPCSTRAHTYGNVTLHSKWPAEPPDLAPHCEFEGNGSMCSCEPICQRNQKSVPFILPRVRHSTRHMIAYGTSFDSAPFYTPRCIWPGTARSQILTWGPGLISVKWGRVNPRLPIAWSGFLSIVSCGLVLLELWLICAWGRFFFFFFYSKHQKHEGKKHLDPSLILASSLKPQI